MEKIILFCLFFCHLGLSNIANAQETIIYPSDIVPSLRFGTTVTAYDDYIVVGTRGGAGAGLAEGVYVFRKNGANWLEEARLTATDSMIVQCFGCALAAYGDYILIGAPSDIENGENSGSAYIFKKEGNNWIAQTKLTPSDATEYQGFGDYVSIYEDYALISAPGDNINGQSNSGSVYIFRREGEQWLQDAKLIPSDPTFYAGFGGYLSIYGDYAFVGAPRAYNTNNVKIGAAYVFKRDGNNWVEQSKLTPSDGIQSDGFSKVIAVNDTTLFVGSSKAPGNNEYSKGAGYIYVREQEDWIEVEKLVPNDFDEENKYLQGCGFSGEYVALASSYNTASAPIHLMKKSAIAWEEIKIVTGLGQVDERYGHDVFLTNDYLVVGAFHTYFYQNNDSIRTGAVYVYDLDLLVSDKEVVPIEASIQLFPNPSTENLTISINNATDIILNRLEVYDMNGRLLQNVSPLAFYQNKGSWTIDVSDLSSGAYIIRGVSDDYTFSKRFVKMKN